MTLVVDLSTYRRLTGDTTTLDATVLDHLADAQQLVEEFLRRPLALAQRTERLRLYRYDAPGAGVGSSWAVYPKATPIDPVATTGYLVQGVALVGVSPDDGPWVIGSYEPGGYATVTYTGGWTTATLPLTIAREISRTAKTLLSPVLSAMMAGATLAMVGDLRVGFKATGAPGGPLDSTSQEMLRPYRRRWAS